MRPDLPELLRRWGDTTTPRDVALATLAAEYVALLSERAPTKTLAVKRRLSRDYIDQRLKEARGRWITHTATARGVPGGELTQRVVAILEKEQD